MADASRADPPGHAGAHRLIAGTSNGTGLDRIGRHSQFTMPRGTGSIWQICKLRVNAHAFRIADMQTSGGKKCPMCGALVDVSAKTCGSCGEAIDAGKPRRVRVRLKSVLPEICALCGTAATQRIQIQFRASRENLGTPIRLPVCHGHRFFRPLVFHEPVRAPVLILIMLVAAIAGVKHLAGWPAAIVAGTVLVGAVVWGVRKALRIRSPFEDSTHIVLTGVAPAFAQACEEIDDREAADVGDALARISQDNSTEPYQQ